VKQELQTQGGGCGTNGPRQGGALHEPSASACAQPQGSKGSRHDGFCYSAQQHGIRAGGIWKKQPEGEEPRCQHIIESRRRWKRTA